MQALIGRGSQYIDYRRADLALEDLNRAISLDPNAAQAYFWRGFIRQSANDIEGAEADYGKAVELDPNYAEAYRVRGSMREHAGRRDEAIADLRRALECDPFLREARDAYRALSGDTPDSVVKPLAPAVDGWEVIRPGSGQFIALNDHYPKLAVPLEVPEEGPAEIAEWTPLKDSLAGVGLLRYRAPAKNGTPYEYVAILDISRAQVLGIEPYIANGAKSKWTWTQMSVTVTDMDGLSSNYELRRPAPGQARRRSIRLFRPWRQRSWNIWLVRVMTAWNRRLRCLLAVCLLALIPGCGSSAPKLPALGADLAQTSVSGLSSGGYMAGQFQVAHSATVTGAAILAAGPYGCAESAAAEALPFFPAATASNLAQAQNGCTADRLSGLGVLDSGTLLRRASALAGQGKIDPLSGLKRAKIYIYTGADDRIVVNPVAEAARNFYLAAGVPAENIEFEFRNPGGHAFLTADKGQACDKSASPYVDNCGYDQAGAILSFIYGPLAPKGAARPENFAGFAQGDYAASSATLADEGVVYIPAACRAEAHCRVHIVFHGCGQSRAQVGDAVTRDTGFADWAETNKIVILFPQAASSVLNPQTCWDWWGYTGLDFLTRDAPQIEAVEAMLARLGQTPEPAPATK